MAVGTSGLLLSAFLGALCRKMQVQLIGKSYPRSWERVPGYLYSMGFFIGAYYVGSNIVDKNRELLQRRLTVLREQRAEANAFHEFDETIDSKRLTADKRGKFFKLMDKAAEPYK